MPTPDRWAQITSLFHQALERETRERMAFLASACGDDLSLKREVESLLVEHERDGVSLESPELAAAQALDFLAQPDPDDAPELLGTVIGGKYRIEALLGKGGMGAVYKAAQLDLEREVAVKVVLSQLLGNRKTVARFKHEAVAVARLRHPHIVTVYDFGMDAAVGAYLVMEYLTGRSLRTEIQGRVPLSIARTVGVMRQICSAVRAAHEAGVIHRDLKPDNVFLTDDGDQWAAKVLDFGVAKLHGEGEDTGLTQAGAIIGTPTYMAPEQIEGRAIDGRADIYSLGCVMYELLVGRPPFTAGSIAALAHKHTYEAPIPPTRKREGIPGPLERVVLRALAKTPDDRFATVAEMERALTAVGIGVDEPGFAAITVVDEDHAETVISPEGRETAVPNNLPEQMSSFVGRAADIAAVKAALEATRLVTLMGPGGIGKTRLALRVAAEVAHQYKDGVWLVELAAIADQTHVASAVATTLGVREPSDRSLMAALGEAAKDQRMLVVLDNCEHVIEASAAVVEALLRAAPEVRVLATSREVLAIAGEAARPVPPLATPAASASVSAEQALESDAVQLFAARAELARPGFGRAAPWAAVVELCRRLDGIPLAIELAAARVKVLTVEQILDRMKDRFRLLTGGARTSAARQQTLRAAIDWSYELLTVDERTMLARLSVFVGGWTLEPAETVCASPPVDELAVLDLLTRLVDKSLVVVDESGPDVRYRMLEMVREYGRERLEASGEMAETRARHAARYLSMAEQMEPELRGPRAGEWLDRVDFEYANLGAALEWFLDGDAEAGLRLAMAIRGFWRDRGRLAEGLGWMTAMLDRTANTSPDLRVRALRWAGTLAGLVGDLETATRYTRASAEIAKRIGDFEELAWSSFCLGNLALVASDLANARVCFHESLGVGRRIGLDRVIADSLNALGEIERQSGDLAAAQTFYEQAVEAYRADGNRRGTNLALTNLGAVACESGDLPLARACYLEALESDVALRNKSSIAYSFDGLASVAAQSGRWRRAARLLGAAQALRDETGLHLEPADSAFRDRSVEVVRQRLGDHALEAAMAEGRALALSEALADAREQD